MALLPTHLYLGWWYSIWGLKIRQRNLAFIEGFLCWRQLFIHHRLFHVRISLHLCWICRRGCIIPNLLVIRLWSLLFVWELQLYNQLTQYILHNREIYKNILFLNIREYHAQFRSVIYLICLGFKGSQFHFQEEVWYI